MPLAAYEYSGTNIPAFLTKLWTLVEDKKYDELIAWDPTGYSFHVYDQTRFAREILPRFFKHNNMASFIRQLNMYGFRKLNSVEQGSLKNEKDDMEFHHPYFVKNKEHLLELIKRKVSSGSSHQIKKEDHHNDNLDVDSSLSNKTNNNNNTNNNSNNNNQNATSASKNPQINTENLVAILQGVKSMHAKQADVVDRLQYLKRENEALWKEISTLRQKHHHQQQIVNKLIHFLVHLVNPASMGIKRSRPLMIDSHSTLTNINDNLSSNGNNNGSTSSNSNKRPKVVEEDDEFIEEPLLKNSRLSPLDHAYIAKKIDGKNRQDSMNSNNSKGVIINDITDTLLKQPLSNSGASAAYNDCDLSSNDIKAPLVDLVADSPSSLQEETADANDFLNSTLFLNAEPQDITYLEESSNNSKQSNKNEDDMKANNLKILQSNNALALSNDTNESTKSSLNTESLYDKTLNIPTQNIPSSSTATASSTVTPATTTSTSPFYLLSTQPEQGLKRSISSSQLLDHVETFQFDLNSIKDFLNTNHSVDHQVLNNLFTADEDFDAFQSLAKQNYDTHSHPLNEAKNDANRITGTEIVQLEPAFNSDIIFDMENVFLPNHNTTVPINTTSNTDLLATPPHLSTAQKQNANLNITEQNGNLLDVIKVSSPTTNTSITTTTLTNNMPFEDDFILNDDFSNTNLLLNNNNSNLINKNINNTNIMNQHARLPVARKASSSINTSKRN